MTTNYKKRPTLRRSIELEAGDWKGLKNHIKALYDEQCKGHPNGQFSVPRSLWIHRFITALDVAETEVMDSLIDDGLTANGLSSTVGRLPCADCTLNQ